MTTNRRKNSSVVEVAAFIFSRERIRVFAGSILGQYRLLSEMWYLVLIVFLA